MHERKGARLTALTSGGLIPEADDYTMVPKPRADQIGTVNEDFAVESIAGDVFQLGNTSYRILRVQPGRVRVEDAQGVAAAVPPPGCPPATPGQRLQNLRSELPTRAT